MARKRVGADNTTTILLVVGGLAAVGAVVYFMSKPSTTTIPTTIYRAPTPTPGLTNSTAQEIAAGGSAVSSIIEAIGDDYN